MPSPIAHVAAGYVVYRLFRRRWPDGQGTNHPLEAGLLAATVALSMLPDVDSVLGIAMGDMGRFHNQVTHSLIVGAGIALGVGVLAYLTGLGQPEEQGSQSLRGNRRQASIRRAMRWFLLVFVCYGLHVILDYFTVGRGVMALWPLSPERFLAPITLFAGLHWSDGLSSVRHLWTALSELLMVLAAGAGIRLLLAIRDKTDGRLSGRSRVEREGQ